MSIKHYLLASVLAIATPAMAQEQADANASANNDCPEPTNGNWQGQRGHHGNGRHGGGHRGGHGMRGGRRDARGAGQRRGCAGGGGHRHWVIPDNEARTLNPIEISSESMARGQAIYSENCQRCHGEFGFGDGPDARELSVRPVPLRHAARMHSDGELNYIIRQGRDPMPSWEDKLSQDQRWDVINYIRYEIGARRGPPFMQRSEKRFDNARNPGEHDMSDHGDMHGGMDMHDSHDGMMQHHEHMDHDSMDHSDMQHDMQGHHDDSRDGAKKSDAEHQHH